MSRVVAIVVAGGVGKRLGTQVHKAFVSLNRKPMLAWTLQNLERSRKVDSVILVTHPDDIQKAARMIRAWRIQKVIRIVPGGKTRSDSVFQGIRALPPQAEWVVVHDAARPLASPQIFDETVKAAIRHRAAIAAVPVIPTVKQAKAGWVFKTLDRNHLWAVQTPQAFERALLEKAHAWGKLHRIHPTDDAALVEALRGKVRIVVGDHRNIKVTTPEDLVVAEALLKKP